MWDRQMMWMEKTLSGEEEEEEEEEETEDGKMLVFEEPSV